jgi:hypothetical protein
MNPKQKTTIIVVALVLVPIILVCCAFALALGCAEFWSSGRFNLIKPWFKRKLSAIRRGLRPIRPKDAGQADEDNSTSSESRMIAEVWRESALIGMIRCAPTTVLALNLVLFLVIASF